MNYFTVAHHTFCIDTPYGEKMLECIPSFQVFASDYSEEKELLFTLKTVEEEELMQETPLRLLDDNWNDVGHWKLYETESGYRVDLSYHDDVFHTLECYRDFRNCQAAIKFEDPYCWLVLNSFIMIVFAQSCTAFQTATIHASVIMKEGKGYAFLGKSGTGKSTHSQLWLQHIPDTELLNDDNPAIRVMGNGEIHIFGTPWSGKTPCYKNKEVTLGGIVNLKQGPQNRIAAQKGVLAYITLLNSCSSLKWNPTLYTALGNTIETVANQVPVFLLENRPDREAAELSYSALEPGTTVPRM